MYTHGRSALPRFAFAALSLCLAACATAPRPAPKNLVSGLSERNDVWRIHFVDVGQGLAVLLEFPCAAMLIDTGAEESGRFQGVDALRGYLDAFFDRRTDLDRTIALLVLTHPHIDHTRGAGMVIDRYRVRNLVHNGMTRGSGGNEQADAIEWAEKNPEAVRHRAVLVEDIPYPAGLTDEVIDPIRCPAIDPVIRAFFGRLAEDPGWGGNRFGKTSFANANNHSVVLRVDYGKASGLFVGDLEPSAIGELLARTGGTGVLDVGIYQVAHHGSSNGTTPELVDAMTPEVAVIPAGPAHRQASWTAWQYGHPRLSVVSMLEERIARRRRPVDVLAAFGGRSFGNHRVEAAIYSTGWDGSVVIEARADGAMRVVTQHGR